MKKQILTALFTIAFILSASIGFSQPPPPPGTGHGQSGNQQGGNAPVGSGLVILLGLGAAYGGKKLYRMHAEEIEE